jgi:hypothetical protein
MAFAPLDRNPFPFFCSTDLIYQGLMPRHDGDIPNALVLWVLIGIHSSARGVASDRGPARGALSWLFPADPQRRAIARR